MLKTVYSVAGTCFHGYLQSYRCTGIPSTGVLCVLYSRGIGKLILVSIVLFLINCCRVHVATGVLTVIEGSVLVLCVHSFIGQLIYM